MFNLNKNVNCLKIQYENDALTVMTVNFAKDQHFPKCILHFTPLSMELSYTTTYKHVAYFERENRFGGGKNNILLAREIILLKT